MRSLLKGPCLLQKEHFTETFDCGIPALNDYLKKYQKDTLGSTMPIGLIAWFLEFKSIKRN